MPLPNLESGLQTFELTIPSTGEVARFRTFLVKEEKLLLIALEGDDKTMQEAIAQVDAACAMTPIKIDKLATFDLGYIFLQLRAKSVNEIVELTYECNKEIELSDEDIERRKANIRFKRYVDGLPPGEKIIDKCGNIVKLQLDLRKVQIQTNPIHSKTIYLTDRIGVTMKYPNASTSRILNEQKQRDQQAGIVNDITNTINTVAMCIESVFDEENQYTNFQQKELVEWLEKLTQPQFVKLSEFFETMPKLTYDLPFHCSKCGNSQTIHLGEGGLSDFFG
jgi:T4 bacteriophage base plate protein